MAAEQGAPLPTPEVSDADWADWLIATQPGELLDLPQAVAAHAPTSA